MEIKEIRFAHGLTQKAMSEITGIPKRSIENWEAGSRKPPEYLPAMIEAYLKLHEVEKN